MGLAGWLREVGGGGRWPMWRVRTTAALLWLLVVGGAAAGVAGFAAAAAPPPTPSPTPAADETGGRGGVDGWAELFVAAWLGAGDGDALAGWLGGRTVELARNRERLYAARTAAVGAEQGDDGLWTVTVAADVLAADDGGWRPAGLRWFEVGVVEVDGRRVAAGLPAQIPAPEPAGDPPRWAAGRMSRPDADDPAVATASRFLGALLAGAGEVDRYATPGGGWRPVSPPPYAAVTVDRVAAVDTTDGGRLMTLEAVAETDGGASQRLGYWLQLARRDGRWEVSAFGGAPPLAAEQESRAGRS